MTKTIIWHDGTLLQGETDDELVANTEAHLRAAHPQLVGQLSRAQILALSKPLPSGQDADRTAPGRPA